ncbi:hypothetical protein M9435_006445 [Picochlorum sp. BPE23]|nr:hypothetical protein M9435_006445 [Picochlorum sp. BPE23]
MDNGVRRTVSQGPGYVNPNLRYSIQARQKKARQTTYDLKKKEWDDWEAQAEREEEAYRATRQLSRLQAAPPGTQPDGSRARRVVRSDYTGNDRPNRINRNVGRRGQVGFPSRVSRRDAPPPPPPQPGTRPTRQEERETPSSSQMEDTKKKFVQQRLMQKVMGFSRVVEDIQTSQRSRMAGDGIESSMQKKNASTVTRNVRRAPRQTMNEIDSSPSMNLDRRKNQERGEAPPLAERVGSDAWAESSSDLLDW